MNIEQRATSPSGADCTVISLAEQAVVAVSANTNAMAALRVMYRNGVHHLPVVSGGACIGLISATDLLFAIAGASPETLLTVAGLCQRPVPHVESTATCAEAAERMLAAGTDALVVTTGGEVMGVLTATHLVRAAADGVLVPVAPKH